VKSGRQYAYTEISIHFSVINSRETSSPKPLYLQSVLAFCTIMYSTFSYILLLASQPRRLRVLVSLLERLNYAVAIAQSEEHAIFQTRHYPPFLIIVAGDHHTWSGELFQELRNHAQTRNIMLIALTDFHAPSWVHQEENPGFDGFLVSPISSDVLSSLVQSAHTRQVCSPIG
jgi:CheY-like chemotaxis protein